MLAKNKLLLNLFILIFGLISVPDTSVADSANNQDVVDFSNIRTHARFAISAYQNKSEIRASGLPAGYKLTHHQTVPEVQVAWLIATNDAAKSQIIAVRGTANIENALVDIALKLVEDKHTGIRLHEGFSFASKEVYLALKPFLKKNYVIHTTGHSLGGAIAMILAMQLDTDDFRVGQVTTFGQPKVTNISGTLKFRHLNVIRVVAPKDIVPLVPPFDPVDINNLDIYWHAGREVVLVSKTTYAVINGLDSMLRATRFTQEALGKENLTGHKMSLYLKRLGTSDSPLKLVPYETSFNLFNLFGS